MGQCAFLRLEELFHAIAHVGNHFVGRVNGVDKEDYFDGLLGGSHDPERGDRTRGFVVEDGEVLLMEGSDGLTGFGVDDDIELDAVG